MRIDAQAIVCGFRAHGEHGAVVRLMTESTDAASYVRWAGRGLRRC